MSSRVYHKIFDEIVLSGDTFYCNIFPDNFECVDIDKFFVNIHAKIKYDLIKFFRQKSERKVIKWCLLLVLRFEQPNYAKNRTIKTEVVTLKSKQKITFKHQNKIDRKKLNANIKVELENIYDSVYDYMKNHDTNYQFVEEIIRLKVVAIDFSKTLD